MTPQQREAALRLADELQRFDGAERESLRDEAAALLRELLAEPVINHKMTTEPAENARLAREAHTWWTALAGATAEIERLRADAERYRWLSEQATQQADANGPIFRISVRRSEDRTLFSLSAAIDAAIKETP